SGAVVGLIRAGGLCGPRGPRPRQRVGGGGWAHAAPALRRPRGVGWYGNAVPGGAPGPAPATIGMAYNPATGTWRDLPAMQYGRDGFAAVWTGRNVLVWGGVTGRGGTALPPHGEAFNPATGTWTALPASPLAGRQNPA